MIAGIRLGDYGVEVTATWSLPGAMDADHSATLNRLRKMKARTRPERASDLAAEPVSLFDSVRHLLTGERVAALRGQLKWALNKEKEDFKDTVTRHLAAGDEPFSGWDAAGERHRLQKLEYRHGSNVPGVEFDKYNRTELESWLRSIDPVAIDGHSTQQMRRIADHHLYRKEFMAMPIENDPDADAEIRAQLERVTGDQPKPQAGKPLELDNVAVQSIESEESDEPKIILLSLDDHTAEDAAAVVHNIASVCQTV